MNAWVVAAGAVALVAAGGAAWLAAPGPGLGTGTSSGVSTRTITGGSAGATAEGARPGQLVPYEDAPAVSIGRGVYAHYCTACHGAALEGEVADLRRPGPDGLFPAPPHDETGHTSHDPDPLLVDIVARGTEAEQRRWSVAATGAR